ncbi:MAG TPA: NAD(P)H-dependent oxidoreductase [Chroococcales cyanobacterium]
MKTDYLIISSSLNPESRSKILAEAALASLKPRTTVEWIDLREYELPLCDGTAAYGHPHVPVLAQKIKDAKCVLLAVAIYNYDVGAAAKNLIELTGRAWTDKVVGFLCAAGGRSSYMSVMGIANSLMLDFRCLILPRFVYADGSAFENGEIKDPEVKKRVTELADAAIRLTDSFAIPV